MDLRAKTCCFTGHRNLSGEEKLKAAVRLRRVIEEQIKAGVVFYGAGGALGFDTLAAQIVLDMKKEYPQLRLILVLPCEDQSRGWRSEDIAAYVALGAFWTSEIRHNLGRLHDHLAQQENRRTHNLAGKPHEPHQSMYLRQIAAGGAQLFPDVRHRIQPDYIDAPVAQS